MADLTLTDVHKRFGAVRAVESLSLNVPAGQRLVVLGPSGCGKTTILRIIAGLEKPDRGTVRLGGQDLAKLAPARRDLAMVFQDAALYPHLNIRENLAFALRAQRLAARLIADRIDEAATAFAITDLLDRYPGTLSGGQRSRVAFARAIAKRPRLLLLDEPLSGLDPPLRWQLQQQWLNWHNQVPTTTVHVTHDQQQAMLMGDRIAVLQDGKLEQPGTPEELYQRPANRFVASFLGSPGMNVTRAQIAAGKIILGQQAIDAPPSCSVADGVVDVGVRPESIQLVAPSASPVASPLQLALEATVHTRQFNGVNWLVAVAWSDQLWWVSSTDSHRFHVSDPVVMLIEHQALHCFAATDSDPPPRGV